MATEIRARFKVAASSIKTDIEVDEDRTEAGLEEQKFDLSQ